MSAPVCRHGIERVSGDWCEECETEVDVFDDEEDSRIVFANPGSALRAASRSNPRNLPCPTCGEPNRLTPADRRRGYQCDQCADRDEGLSFPY